MTGDWPSPSYPSDSSGSSVNEPASLNGMSRTESSNSAFLASLNKKQPRFSNSNEAVISVDRISDMPYSILCFILSFLSTKEAVATSILSKRWQLVWTGISSLDFGNCWTTKHRICNYLRNHNEQDNKGSVSFEQSINQVFHLFGAESIEKFHLEWPHDKYPFSVDGWIATALSRNLRVLSIYFCCHHLRIRLPDTLFTCKTLEVLALGGGISINVPCSVSFPRLISLNLESVYYETDESFCKIISACPFLNSLHIVRYPYDNLVKLNISCSSLRRLEVRTKAEHRSGTNFNFVDPQHKLEIDAPALECLYLHDRISKNFTIKSPASLVEADIDVNKRPIYSADSAFRHSVVELVQALCYAKCLTLSRGTMKALGLATTRLSVKFPRLTKLEIQTDMCDWSTLKDLLQCSENLEVLHHCKKDPYNIVGVVPYDFCWKEPNEVPRCLSSSLREISISNLGGFQDELVFIRYILEHGRVVRRMELKADYFVPEERFKVLQLITFCTRKFSRFEIVHGRGMPD